MYGFKLPFLLAVKVLWVSIPFSLAEMMQPIARAFTLTASEDHLVHGVTLNFSLKCAFNTNLDPSQLSLAEISRIRILRNDGSDQWKLVAEIKENEHDVHLYDNMIGTGQIVQDIRSVNLKLTWPIVTVTTFGKYRCDVTGFDRNLDYAVEKSNIVILAERNIEAQDVLDLLLAEQNQFQHDLDSAMKLNEKKLNILSNVTDEKLKTMNMSINEKFEKINNTTEEELHKGVKTIKLSIDEKLKAMNLSIGHKYEPWPEGTYSLLAPITGCPHSSEWRKGFFKMHTESSRSLNSDFVSQPSHLPPYTRYSDGGQNFMILTYCSKIKSPGIPWPSGTYCINRRGSCPKGFHSGYVKIDMENTNHRSKLGGYDPALNYGVHYFCCRSDSPASIAIHLPTADPFFLYRFTGTCQNVANMRLTTGHIQIDTEDLNNQDKYKNIYHPDGKLNPVVIELCHYRPK